MKRSDLKSVRENGTLLDEKMKYARRSQVYGLCSKCDNLSFRRTHLDDEEAWCDAYSQSQYHPHTRPNKQDVIISCSQYYPAGQMSIDHMISIATIIDIKKKQIGFNNQEETEVTIITQG